MSNVKCPYCGSTSIYNVFENENGIRWRCIECKNEFINWKDNGDENGLGVEWETL